jgi:hypothetical protein
MVCVKVSPGCTLSRPTEDAPASAAATTVIEASATRLIWKSLCEAARTKKRRCKPSVAVSGTRTFKSTSKFWPRASCGVTRIGSPES